ncbi:MAG TPA: universal stress protein [Actinomycetota bacterium]|nr:universal stress protein [Actinomycetota bacterium]
MSTDPLTVGQGQKTREKHRATVVVGLDGSDTSWDACSWACGEARRLGARIVAVYVTPIAEVGLAATAAGAAAVTEALDESAARQAEQLREQLFRTALDGGCEMEFVHARGEPASELVRVAEAVQADQIVVGRSTKALHHVAGSIGRRLIAKRGAPVVVVVP